MSYDPRTRTYTFGNGTTVTDAEVANRGGPLRSREFSRRTMPVRWFDLVTFDPAFLTDDKTVRMVMDADGVYKPHVYDATGKQVYPCE